MSIEASNEGDSTDIFWPGYVDAVTNLVLNLLFMLTIMIVAVFMFALELSRHKDDKPTPIVETPASQQQVASATPPTPPADIVKAKDTQIKSLQKQVDDLKKQVMVKNELSGNQKVVIAKTPIPKPEKELEKAAPAGGGVVVNFQLDAVTLSQNEAETLRNNLGTIASNGAARVEVVVPAGFSEARRLGFYRAMAVRNQLIEMNVPAEKIDVSVREGKPNADNSKVLVTPR